MAARRPLVLVNGVRRMLGMEPLQIGRAAIDPTGLTANRTHTLPDQTGTIALTANLPPDASTSVKGIVQLSTSTSSTSTTLAATPSAVKAAYDRAATAAGWDALIFFESGNYELQAGKEYFIVAIGAGGRGARNINQTRATGGNGGGVAAKAVSVGGSNLTLTLSVGAGASSPSTNTGSGDGVAGGNTTVSGTGISLNAPGGAGGVQGTGTQQPAAPTAPTGGDFNYTGGRAGSVNNTNQASAGASIFGANSVNITTSARTGTPTSPTQGGGMSTVTGEPAFWQAIEVSRADFPNTVDSRVRLALLAINAISKTPVGFGTGGTVATSTTTLDFVAGARPTGVGAGSGGTVFSAAPWPTAPGGDGAVVILERL